MTYRVQVSAHFDKEARKIIKKHRGVIADIAQLISDLSINPTIGVHLGQNLYKIRLSISGTNRGKSGGARVITYVTISDQTVLLAEIYLKAEHDTVDESKVIQRLKNAGLI